MGSGASRLISCVRPPAAYGGDPDYEAGPLDETLGHSFCYVRSSSPAHSRTSSASSTAEGGGDASAAEIAFKTISGASVSANSSAPLPVYSCAGGGAADADFQSSSSFSALPLQLSGGGGAAASRPIDRGFFLSGPIERGALSGPLDSIPFSGPLVKKKRRALSRRFWKPSLLRRSISEKNPPWVVPLRSFQAASESVQWAHGKAGEDRVYVVVSEEQRWLFVGIYDGFNGPDAPDFLVGNLYRCLFDQLRGLFWEDAAEPEEEACEDEGCEKRGSFREDPKISKPLWQFLADGDSDYADELGFSGSGRFTFSLSKLRYGIGSWRKDSRKVWLPKWRYVSEDKVNETKVAADHGDSRRRKAGPVANHELVLSALSRALEATELAYLEMTDKAMDCNPEIALMGSCLLVVLMRDEDVYVMNVGDSRAVIGQYRSSNLGQMDRHVDENGTPMENEALDRGTRELGALQLSTDHSTSIEEEVLRIKQEHPDDKHCIVNDRVKGRLKVTRAFGVGYLKQPKWNNGLLEMFRNEYIGTSPYISCMPSLRHHKLGSNDQFLVLSSDGLYQYLSNEEVVLHVESFMEKFPDGDPAQSLIEELLFRAAKKAGMDLYELLDIPQGDRRKYHDDVTVMVVSLEGRIWKSSGKYV